MTNEAKTLSLIGISTLILLVGAVFFLSKNTQPQTESTIATDPTRLIRADSNKIGTDSAKVKIVEFGDFQCPACGVAHPTVKQIINDYQDKVQFVFRNFPLPMHLNAKIAAQAAEASGEQGKYWEMHDLLYEKQNEWESSTNPMSVFTEYAKSLNLDINTFQKNIQDSKYTNKITEDQNDGNALNVNATPTFFINGQKIEGTPSLTNFKAKIDAELNK